MLYLQTADDLLSLIEELRGEFSKTQSFADREIGRIQERHARVVDPKLVELNEKVQRLTDKHASITTEFYFNIENETREIKIFLVYHGRF